MAPVDQCVASVDISRTKSSEAFADDRQPFLDTGEPTTRSSYKEMTTFGGAARSGKGGRVDLAARSGRRSMSAVVVNSRRHLDGS